MKKNGRQAFSVVPHQPALCGSQRKDGRASRTRGHARDSLRRSYTRTHCVLHISCTLQHMCMILHTKHTRRVDTFLNTADNMPEMREPTSTRHAPRTSCAFFRTQSDHRSPNWQQSCCLLRSEWCTTCLSAFRSRRAHGVTSTPLNILRHLPRTSDASPPAAALARGREAAAAAARVRAALRLGGHWSHITSLTQRGCPPRADAHHETVMEDEPPALCGRATKSNPAHSKGAETEYRSPRRMFVATRNELAILVWYTE